MKIEKRILLSMICLICTFTIITPAFSGPPYYHEEGNVNYPGAYFESDYTAMGIGVDDYITLIDMALTMRAYGSYNPDCDFDNNGKVDLVDLVRPSWFFGLNYHYSQFQTILGDTTVTLNAPTNPMMIGEQFTVDVAIDWALGVNEYEFTLSWNPGLLEVVSVADGSLGFGDDGGPFPIIGTNYIYVGDMFNQYGVAEGSGTLAQITFECKGPGISILDLSSRLLDVDLYSMPHQDEDATITVGGPEEHTQQLIQTIDSWSLPAGTKASLTSKLQAALDLLAQGNEVGAIHKLLDFIQQVEAFRGKKLTNQQADYLVAEAQETILLTG